MNMKSNEFTGASLYDAVRNATAAYDRTPDLELKRSCAEIEIRIELEKSKLSDVADRSEELKRRAESLEREARRKLLKATAEALIAIAGPLGLLGRIARLIVRLRKGRITRRDVQNLVPAIAAVTAAKDALDAIDDFQEAGALASQADRLINNAEDTRDKLFELIAELDSCEPIPMS